MDEAHLSETAAQQVEQRLQWLFERGAPKTALRRFADQVRRMQVHIGANPRSGVDRPELGATPSVQGLALDGCTYLWTADIKPPLIVAMLAPGQDPDTFFSSNAPIDLM
jgi:hypothetical protein